jgi:hypothetical protein
LQTKLSTGKVSFIRSHPPKSFLRNKRLMTVLVT